MQVINVILDKVDDTTNNVAINLTDTASEQPDENIRVDYDSLDAGQQATADAFFALALSLIPA